MRAGGQGVHATRERHSAIRSGVAFRSVPYVARGSVPGVALHGPIDFRPAIVVTRKVRQNGQVVKRSDLLKDFAGVLATATP